MVKTDRQIHEAVLQELKWDTRVDETEVGVEVDKGIVTLTGTVTSYAKKMAAQEAAHRVTGVLDVANDIQVRVPDGLAHTDTEIALAVRRALEWDALVAHEKIETTVANGWVTLEGSVPFWADRSYAERAVHNLTGVRGVTNRLTISAPTVASATVRHSIEAALERRAEREAERIAVEVKDGTVSLTGRVHNWNEKQAVLGAAGCAHGVRKVEDHLSVDPYF
jgi:osmotically-inducible protein OsmY